MYMYVQSLNSIPFQILSFFHIPIPIPPRSHGYSSMFPFLFLHVPMSIPPHFHAYSSMFSYLFLHVPIPIFLPFLPHIHSYSFMFPCPFLHVPMPIPPCSHVYFFMFPFLFFHDPIFPCSSSSPLPLFSCLDLSESEFRYKPGRGVLHFCREHTASRDLLYCLLHGRPLAIVGDSTQDMYVCLSCLFVCLSVCLSLPTGLMTSMQVQWSILTAMKFVPLVE